MHFLPRAVPAGESLIMRKLPLSLFIYEHSIKKIYSHKDIKGHCNK